MIGFDEALDLVLHAAGEISPRGRERLSLERCSGRVLAQDLVSPIDLPQTDYSAMDGYAVSSPDFDRDGRASVMANAGDVGRLRVVGASQTGHSAHPLEPGTCCRIFTGAQIPLGADAVVMQENVRQQGEEVHFLKRPRKGENVRRRGEDLAKGQCVLPEGTRLNAYQLGLLASAEYTEVPVARRPKVVILCTGDELRPPGATMWGGQLAESNSVALRALCERAGASVECTPIVKDDMEQMEDELRGALAHADVVLTVGGVSVGQFDLVHPALERLSAQILFHKVRIKPGKPALLAKFERSLVLGLPGNPSSAQVVFSLLGFPLLRALQGDQQPVAPQRTARLKETASQKVGRRGFYRALLSGDEVELFANQASGAHTSMAWANALVVLDEETEKVEAGERVNVLAYTDF